LLFISVVAATAASTGCANILEDDWLLETPHLATPYERPPEEQIEVSSFDELKAEMLKLIMGHESAGQFVIYSYDGGDVQADIDRACRDIMNVHPIGVYAVSMISGVATRIVSYFEVDISIEYRKTRQQLESIVNVSTLRYLRTELLSIISEYRDEAVFRTSLQVTEDDIIRFVREAYYQNPRRIVMLPVTAIEIFPATGDDRIFELRFVNIRPAGLMLQFGTSLTLSVRRHAELAVGDTDSEILLSLVNNLIASISFDEGMARTISVHGAQNLAATAYGALQNGNAVGEGFAMAFKAICDELEFDCRVVLGELDGMIHAWNIVALYGDFYHIDIAMGAANGIETAFLKTDADFIERYTWDTENHPRCEGTLTYEDIVGEEEPDETENGDNGENDYNGDNRGDGSNGNNGDNVASGQQNGESGGGTEPPDGGTEEPPGQSSSDDNGNGESTGT
jgi:hypothetical protein